MTTTQYAQQAPSVTPRLGCSSRDRIKPNALGLRDVVSMAVATSAPATATGGSVPFSVDFDIGTGTYS